MEKQKIKPEIFVGMSSLRLNAFTPGSISYYVCENFQVTQLDLFGKNRTRHVVDGKRAFVYLADKYMIPKPTLQEIGKLIHKNHATVLYHLRSSKELMDSNSVFKELMEQTEKQMLRK